MDEILCASLGLLQIPRFDSLSLEPASVGLCDMLAVRLVMEFFLQTNLSKSCSSLLSRSPMCVEQGLLCSGPELLTEETSAWLDGP
jgi:hypothetical protein